MPKKKAVEIQDKSNNSNQSLEPKKQSMRVLLSRKTQNKEDEDEVASLLFSPVRPAKGNQSKRKISQENKKQGIYFLRVF